MKKPRWQLRFDNYSRAVSLLGEAVEAMAARDLTALEKEGAVQRFEFALELAWKTMKDYLEWRGTVFDEITPRQVIKAAIAAKLVENGQDWMDAIDARNRMSHTYNSVQFEKIVMQIRMSFFPAMAALHDSLAQRKAEDE